MSAVDAPGGSGSSGGSGDFGEATPVISTRADGRRAVRTGSPWEDVMGLSRAVEIGDRVLVGGTTAFRGSVLHGEGDPYEQARTAFANALGAIAALGLGPESVVLTRMLLTHTRDAEAVGRAHKELFDEVRPVTTLSVVSGFVDPRILVEVEIEAVRPPKPQADRPFEEL